MSESERKAADERNRRISKLLTAEMKSLGSSGIAREAQKVGRTTSDYLLFHLLPEVTRRVDETESLKMRHETMLMRLDFEGILEHPKSVARRQTETLRLQHQFLESRFNESIN